MSEPSEATLRERKFHKARGVTPKNLSVYSSRRTWNSGVQNGVSQVQKVSGQDVKRAGGSVSKARSIVNKTGTTYFNKPKRAAKKKNPTIKGRKQDQMQKSRLTSAFRRNTR